MYIKEILVGAILLVSTAAVWASEGLYNTTPRSTYYLGVGQASFDNKTATNEGIDESATYVRLAWEGQQSTWLYSAGLSGFFYSDSRDFKQTVKDQYGNISNASSTSDSFNLYGEGGYSYPMTRSWGLDFLGGYEQVIQSKRSISNCSNCYSEDIDINAGLYIIPRIRYQADNGFSMSLSYQQFMSGDVDDTLALIFGYTK